MVKVRGRNSNGKTVKQTAEKLARATSWCHTGATSQSWQGHATESRFRDQPESARVKWWHDADTTMTAIVVSLIIVTQSSHDASNLDPMSQEIFVTFWYLLASCRQVSIVDCSNGVFSSINRLPRWTVKIMLSLLSKFWSRTIRTKAQLPWLSTRTTLFMCSWLLAHRRQPRRRKTTRTYYRFWKSRWNNELRCIGFGWLRSPISINQESEDNIELLPLIMYLVSHSVLCHCLVKQHSRNDEKKKKKRLSDVSVPQSWPRWAHSVSHTRVTVERGIKFGIDQNRDAAANCWRLAPVTHAGRAASSPEIFRPFLTVCLTVFPFEFRPRTFTIGFYGKKSFISELMILECSFPLINSPPDLSINKITNNFHICKKIGCSCPLALMNLQGAEKVFFQKQALSFRVTSFWQFSS